MFDGGLGAQFVVHDDGTDRTGLQLAADHCSRNIVLLQIAQHVDILAELMGGPPNSIFDRVGYITSERRIVQHNRDRGRREAALFRHLTNGHHNRISFFDAELLT